MARAAKASIVKELKEQLEYCEQRSARMESMYSAELARNHDALEGLMKDVMKELCIDHNYATSIVSGRMIEALAKANRILHSDSKRGLPQ